MLISIKYHIILLAASLLVMGPSRLYGQMAAADNRFYDTQTCVRVLNAAETTFPNLADEHEYAELLRKVSGDPTLRGNLRGRLAESDWIERNAGSGWQPVRSANAPQNDAFRFVQGRLEGAQVKVHSDWHKYIESMRKDYKAERFVLPDDHYDLVYKELEARRIGAISGGLTQKASEYARQQQRLTKLGRNYSEIDSAIDVAAKHYGRIAKALRAAGRASSLVGIAVSILDLRIVVHDVAVGRADVDELVFTLGKVVGNGLVTWGAASAASSAAVAAGATGAIPVAVAIIVGTATYLVVDWAVDNVADAMRVGRLSEEDVRRLWPEGARGIPLHRLYRKPADPASIIK